MSNGNNPQIIEELLRATTKYRYKIKISLDGTEKIHNMIRGSNNSFENTLKTLDCISQYNNITLYISTSLQRSNLESIRELDQFIKEHYPTAIHTKDIVFPMGNGCSCALSLNELKVIQTKFPELVQTSIQENNREILERHQKKHRCSGGITQCTLLPNGNLKICNAACDDQFYFQFNAFSSGLEYAWINCGEQILKFRKEKIALRKNVKCKQCKYRKDCHGNDCRILSWVYTGDVKNHNPLTCIKGLQDRE